jgi:hypothetical protein
MLHNTINGFDIKLVGRLHRRNNWRDDAREPVHWGSPKRSRWRSFENYVSKEDWLGEIFIVSHAQNVTCADEISSTKVNSLCPKYARKKRQGHTFSRCRKPDSRFECPWTTWQSVQERTERHPENEGCQDLPWPRRIRLLGNLVFGTRGRRFQNFLKSSASVSEKHEADRPAETADKRFSRRTPNHHQSDAITVCFETSCGDLCGDLFGRTASTDLT